MTKLEVKNKSEKELTKVLTEKREDLRKVRFGFSGSTKHDTKSARGIRKDISRILTELNNPERK
jgi:ribosomal protein L29